MRVDFHQKDLWESLCEKIRAELKNDSVRSFAADQALRVYNGLPQALYEMAVGTAQFFAFKKSIAFVSGNSWAFEGVLPYFYKETYQVQNLKYSDYSNAAQFIAGLNKDTVILLLAEDHPVTGELYPFQEIEKLASDKKIFVVRVSHQAFHYHASKLQPNSIQLQSWSPNLALAKLGARVKTPVLLANQMHWDHANTLKQLKEILAMAKEDKAAVTKFESDLPEGFQAFLSKKERLYDRSAICAKDGASAINGEALLRLMIQKLQLKDSQPGFMNSIETSNECRWGGFAGYKSWWEPQTQSVKSDSILLFAAQILNDQNLKSVFASSIHEATKL